MTAPDPTRSLLAALALVTAAVVAYDVRGRYVEPRQPVAQASPAVAPAPEVRRGFDKTPLLYRAEFVAELAASLRRSLVTATPLEPERPPSSGYLFGPDLAVVSPAHDAASWRIDSGGGPLAARPVAVDLVHDVAVLRASASGAPLSPRKDPPGPAGPLVALRREPDGLAMRVHDGPGSSPSALAAFLATLAPGTVVVDLDGRVVALATGSTAEALAGPSLGALLDVLGAGGAHPHPWAGVELQAIDPSLRWRFPAGGLVAVHVEEGSPAAQAGLTAGMAFERVEAADAAAQTPGEVARLIEGGAALLRFVGAGPRGTALEVPVRDRQEAIQAALYGLAPVAAHAGVPVRVAPAGAAAAAGLVAGDLIEAVDLRPVHAWRDLERALASRGPHLLTVRRGSGRRFAGLEGGP